MKCGLDDLNETFMIDVHKDQQIYLNDPEPAIPASKSGRGRRSRQYKSTEKTLQVQKFIQQKSGLPWKKITLPESEKGALTVELNEEEIPLLNLFGSYFPPRSLLRLLSFRHIFSRNPECLKFRTFWIPACAGMTVFQEPEGQEPDGQACAIA